MYADGIIHHVFNSFDCWPLKMRTPNSQALNLWISGSRFGAEVRITDARCALSGSSLSLVGKSMQCPTLPENQQKV
jgi:hypothetical protein